MFKITCVVRDKDLGEAFKRLNEIATHVSYAYTTRGEGQPNGKASPKPDISDKTGSLEKLTTEIHKRHLTELTADSMRDVIDKAGLNPVSYSYFIRRLVEMGNLKKGGRTKLGQVYTVTGK